MDIKGWDFITAINVDYINNKLEEEKDNLISDFVYANKNGSASISGRIESWELVSNSNDKLNSNDRLNSNNESKSLLRFQCLFSSCELSIKNNAGEVITKTLDSIKPELELQLNFESDSNLGSVLKFNLKTIGTCAGDVNDGAVTIISPDTSGHVTQESDIETWSILNMLIPEMFLSNKDRLKFVFATINDSVNISVDWLKPTQYIYSYIPRSDKKTGYLVIFSLTSSSKKISELSTEIDSSLFDDEHSVFYFISTELFMKNIILPAICCTFDGCASVSDFSCDANGVIDINGGKTISCNPVKYGLINYYPQINVVHASLNNNTIQMKISGYFNITGLDNAYVDIWADSELSCQFDSTTQEFRIITNKQSSDYKKHIPWYDYTLALVLGGLIAAIVDVIILLVTNSIADAVRSSIVSKGNFACNIPNVICWFNDKSLQVKDANIAQVMYVKV